jgi:hypothetical protein
VDAWDIYLTDEVAAWLQHLQATDPKTADLIDDAIYALSFSGPALGRPLVDAEQLYEIYLKERAEEEAGR